MKNFIRMRSRQRQRGMSLVELMIGATIGLALLAALGSLYVATAKARAEFNKTGEQVENGRFALESMTRDIETAGFYGRPGLPAAPQFSTPDACVTAKTSMGFDATTTPTTVPVPVYGIAQGGTASSCLSDRVVGSEAITVRYASTIPTTVAAMSTTEFYLQQSSCNTDTTALVYSGTSTDFTLQDKTCDSSKPAELRKYVERTYYLARCDNCSNTNNHTPTLKVAEFIDGSMKVSSLVAGIQDMHLSYGIDTDGNGSPDCYVDNPALNNATICTDSTGYSWANAATNWSNVTVVRVTVLARNVTNTVGWKDTRSYDLGRGSDALNGPYYDSYKRHVYSASMRLWNVGGPREN